MSYPNNPDQVILKNKFYSKGMKEIDVWNYYQSYKGPILNETRGRELMFAIMTDVNKPIIKRKTSEGFIKFTNSNYDKLITGRSIAVYSTMQQFEDIAIVDIDINNFGKAKRAASDVYDIMMKFPIAQSVSCRYTGKDSFHIVCKIRRKVRIDSIRMMLQQHLEQNNPGNYTIKGKRTSGIVNLDLSPNKFRGAFITLNSLSIIGWRCVEVPYERIPSFSQSAAKIKIS